MTHKARILKMLVEAGEKGVSSKLLYREFMGRGAARIKELREEGHQIDSSEKDPADPKFCIYRLQEQCGVTRRSINEHAQSEANPATARIDLGTGQEGAPGDKSEVPATATEATLFELDPPSAYNPWSEAA